MHCVKENRVSGEAIMLEGFMLLQHQKRIPPMPREVHFEVHGNSFKETRQSKQLRPKTIPFFFLERKNELPRAGFEPATFCVLGKRSPN